MPMHLSEPWLGPARFQPRVALMHVLTAQGPNPLRHQTQLIEECIEGWIKNSGLEVATFFADREASIRDELRYQHDPAALWLMWTRAMVVSDLLIVHAHENGSAALGDFVRRAAEAPHAPPVLVILPEGTTISKAWKGQTEHLTNVRFIAIDGDGSDLLNRMSLLVGDIMAAYRRSLTNGPAVRQMVEGLMRRTSQPLYDDWEFTSEAQRSTLACDMAMSTEWLTAHIEDPMLLASLGHYKQALLFNAVVLPREEIMADAEVVLDQRTLDAWHQWAANTPPSQAFRHLRRAVDAKHYEVSGISQPLDLTEPGLWEAYALGDLS